MTDQLRTYVAIGAVAAGADSNPPAGGAAGGEGGQAGALPSFRDDLDGGSIGLK